MSDDAKKPEAPKPPSALAQFAGTLGTIVAGAVGKAVAGAADALATSAVEAAREVGKGMVEAAKGAVAAEEPKRKKKIPAVTKRPPPSTGNAPAGGE